jgi:glyoxylase-like metal-dependent hydrolase (beta-lactamase superfamily II)
MLIKTFVVGQLQTNCYVVTDEATLECAVIDPGAESGRILNYIEDNKLKLKCIFITHGHFDHTMAVPTLFEATGARVFINGKDANQKSFDEDFKRCGGAAGSEAEGGLAFYSEGDSVRVGNLEFKVMETPGHSRGSITLMCENCLFTGDTLFKDSCGRTDFEGGSYDVLMKSLRRLYQLPGDYEVYPGHADTTTLDRERRFNYYMNAAMEA